VVREGGGAPGRRDAGRHGAVAKRLDGVGWSVRSSFRFIGSELDALLGAAAEIGNVLIRLRVILPGGVQFVEARFTAVGLQRDLGAVWAPAR